MLFNYKSIDAKGTQVPGSIDAVSMEAAILSLQRRGMTIVSIEPVKGKSAFLSGDFGIFNRVKTKDVVVLSRQLATLFEAQVSALRVFKLVASESPNPTLRKHLSEITDDLQGGLSISASLAKHPSVFSAFYVNMVKSGEESGKLTDALEYLADYIDRSYEVTAKAKNALIYPAFVMVTFFVVMSLMLTMVIPRISSILTESDQAVPIYTRAVIGVSEFLVNYGIFALIAIIVGGFVLWRYTQSGSGKVAFDRFKLTIPFIGSLYRKLYLSRLADNMNTMLQSGIPMVRAIEITAEVVDNKIYQNLLIAATNDIKGGRSVSDALAVYPEIPTIMVQMIKIGEETGEVGKILQTLAKFYTREVINAVDTLVDLIEPAMIVMLGLGVGGLLASVLIPIYNISSGL